MKTNTSLSYSLFKKYSFFVFLILLNGVLLSSVYAAKVWYRYKNASGVTAVSGQLTPEHIKYGYEELDASMRVMRQVPPFSQSRYEAEHKKRAAQSEQQASDNLLLQTHVSASKARMQKQALLAVQNQKLLQVNNQLATFNRLHMQDMANAQRLSQQKKAVPKMLQDKLNEQQLQIDKLTQAQNGINNRINQINSEYDRIIARLEAMNR